MDEKYCVLCKQLQGDCAWFCVSCLRRIEKTSPYPYPQILWEGLYNLKGWTLGVDVHTITLGNMRFNVWDCAGQEKFGGLRDAYYLGSQCAIVMFDVTSRLSFKNVPCWVRDWVNYVQVHDPGHVGPIVIVGCKSDASGRKIQREINGLIKKLSSSYNVRYVEISNKMMSVDELYEPLRKLTNML